MYAVDTVSTNKKYAVDTVSTNKKYAVDTVSTNKMNAVDTVSTNKKFIVDAVSLNKNAAKQTRQHAVKNKGGDAPTVLPNEQTHRGRRTHNVTQLFF